MPRIIAAALAVVCLSLPAQARRAPIGHLRCTTGGGCGVVMYDARPRAWCGWYARHSLAARDPGPAFNLARAWAHWGRAASPGAGVMVVWRHHVGMITGSASGGLWFVKSGNDGGRVRERPRSLAGAIAFRSD